MRQLPPCAARTGHEATFGDYDFPLFDQRLDLWAAA
jgi:hypothetical protein